MPITCPIGCRPIRQDDFAKLDYRVMGCAFESQNELGRLCEEVIYRNDLAERVESAGLGPVHREAPVTVSHRDFSKTYRLDLVVADAAVYELKTEARLAADHESQLLNYLFLYGAQHGKLINFRPAKIESRFVNTTLTQETRGEFEVDLQRWQEPDKASRMLRTTLVEVLEDWGGFLELSLYQEVLTHFLGGQRQVVQSVALRRDGAELGNQRFHLLDRETAFKLTALAGNCSEYEPQLWRLLQLSPLKILQWINVAYHRVTFVSLLKK